MKLGLSKLAEDNQTEIIQPEEKQTLTSVICNSNCQYSQNPEKVCMLKNVALVMEAGGEFSCSQYAPFQQMQEEEQPGQEGQMARGGAGPSQAKRELGLAGAKTKN